MAMNAPLFFATAGDERGTPQVLFDALDREFHFDLDAAATRANAKCELYYGEGGIADNALVEDWGGIGSTIFLNPPYSKVGAFVAKAREEANDGARVVLLLPVRSDTRWWHGFVWDRLTEPNGYWYPGVQCRFLPGRLNFELHVPLTVRSWIKSELATVESRHAFAGCIQALVRATGLPKIAIERIYLDQPDETLLDAAPFPSCVVIFSQYDTSPDIRDVVASTTFGGSSAPPKRVPTRRRGK